MKSCMWRCYEKMSLKMLRPQHRFHPLAPSFLTPGENKVKEFFDQETKISQPVKPARIYSETTEYRRRSKR